MKTKTVAMAALLGATLTSPIVNAGQFCINGTMEKRFGRAPGVNLEVEFKQTDDNLVLIGIGLRASRGNIKTMLLKYARIKDDGTIDRDYPIEIKTGTEPESGLEVYAESEELDRVIVGCGVRGTNNNITTLHIHTRKFDPKTGELTAPRTLREGTKPNSSLEADGKPLQDAEHKLLRGVGFRFKDNNVTTMAHYYGTVAPCKPN